MTYAEKLKDPRWQKRRLEIMDRDEWTCQMCGATDKTMHTHHLLYVKGREPWDYTDAGLQCLCEDCNKKEGRVPVVTQEQVHSLNTMMGCISSNDCNQIELWEVALKAVKNTIKFKERENQKSRDDMTKGRKARK